MRLKCEILCSQQKMGSSSLYSAWNVQFVVYLLAYKLFLPLNPRLSMSEQQYYL